MDLLLDNSNDLVFINGKCPVTRDLAESTIQRLKIKLNTFYGEWFLNTEYGVPYYEEIFGKNRLKSTIDSIFQEQILEDENVIKILEFSSSISADRRYSLTFRIQVVDGSESDSTNVLIGE